MPQIYLNATSHTQWQWRSCGADPKALAALPEVPVHPDAVIAIHDLLIQVRLLSHRGRDQLSRTVLSLCASGSVASSACRDLPIQIWVVRSRVHMLHGADQGQGGFRVEDQTLNPKVVFQAKAA